MGFSATIDSGVLRWHEEFGLLGPPLEVFEIVKLLDGSDILPFGPGPILTLEETNPYAVLWAINQTQPEAELTGDVPDFDDILGPFEDDVIY